MNDSICFDQPIEAAEKGKTERKCKRAYIWDLVEEKLTKNLRQKIYEAGSLYESRAEHKSFIF